MARVSGCKGCDRRAPGCHGTCEDYREYNEEREKIRNARARSQAYDNYYYGAKRRDYHKGRR